MAVFEGLIGQIQVEVIRLVERKYRAEAEEAEAKRDTAQAQLERERLMLQYAKDQIAVESVSGLGGGDA